MKTLPQKIEHICRAWPQWSPAETRVMDNIVKEVLRYYRTGEGNTFIKQWCEKVLQPALHKIM